MTSTRTRTRAALALVPALVLATVLGAGTAPMPAHAAGLPQAASTPDHVEQGWYVGTGTTEPIEWAYDLGWGRLQLDNALGQDPSAHPDVEPLAMDVEEATARFAAVDGTDAEAPEDASDESAGERADAEAGPPMTALLLGALIALALLGRCGRRPASTAGARGARRAPRRPRRGPAGRTRARRALTSGA